MKRTGSHQHWTWSVMLLFIMLSVLDIRFGLLGFACIGAPLYHAARGHGKVHCSKYCPRGSLLGRFLQRISWGNSLPASWRSPMVKHALVALMLAMFGFSLSHALLSPRPVAAVAFATFRLMMVSLVVGMIMGVVFKPRSWCQICPMGHGTALISKAQQRRETREPVGKGQGQGAA